MNKINLKYLLEMHKTRWSLEKPFYTNQQIFAHEWEYIWKKYWLFAGTTADIPKPGDYFIYPENYSHITASPVHRLFSKNL